MKNSFTPRNLTKWIAALATLTGLAQAQDIQHDSEHYILLDQHEKSWAKEDKQIDKTLEEVRKKHGDRPPNIVFVLVDDIGFGEFGNPILNKIRGSNTPNINKLAQEGTRFARMYAEPSCTPTRAAFLTGRIPTRSYMLEAKIVPPEGSGLNGDEVTIAEVLSQAGYNTAHVGKWHQGDIEEAMPHNQGFDVAMFPMHNQATFNLMIPGSEETGWGFNNTPRENTSNYRLDDHFRLSGWALGMEAKKGEKAVEWGTKPGDPANYSYDYYNKLNNRYCDQAVSQLTELAAKNKPFFLNYWPSIPLTFDRSANEKYVTANGGVAVESLRKLDDNIGEIIAEIERLGIGDNTIIAIMGDNGPMAQAMPYSGFSDMIFRGGKGSTTEGGIRVDALIRWPNVIPAGEFSGDIIHVTDLYTSFARIAQATEFIPRDRVIDGIDQTPLFLLGDTKGRRDYIHVYDGPHLAATIKEQYKVQWPAAGAPAWSMKIFDLYRDPREVRPLTTQGMWTVEAFIDMKKRHLALKEKFPDRLETFGEAYAGVKNLRPETIELLENHKKRMEILD